MESIPDASKGYWSGIVNEVYRLPWLINKLFCFCFLRFSKAFRALSGSLIFLDELPSPCSLCKESIGRFGKAFGCSSRADDVAAGTGRPFEDKRLLEAGATGASAAIVAGVVVVVTS